ncbi:MAG: GTP-binding protein [Candidatus Heimdallarchaeota archaeon]|nr:GTP-binding protein [Candidatus Heimdallarchaeota archaeon]
MQGRNIVLKICLAGSWGSGKTSLRKAYMGDRLKRNYQPTVGADFSLKTMELNGENYQLLIWDIAGEQRFSNVRDVYFQGSFGVLLIFDLTRKESFNEIDDWLVSIEKSTQSKGVPIVLIGNKKDLAPLEINQCVNNATIQAKIEELNKRYEGQFTVPYIETSAMTKTNVEQAFVDLISSINKWIPIRNRRLQHFQDY